MNPCAKNKKEIALLAAGGARADSTRELRAHLRACGACQQYFEEMSRVIRNLESTAPETSMRASDEFHRKVAARIVLHNTSFWPLKFQRLFRPARLGPGAAVLALVAMLFVVASRDKIKTASSPATHSDVAFSFSPPTLGFYQMTANHSLDDIDRLLSRQAKTSSGSEKIYTAASVLSVADQE
jgi:anti-sigma factor RsiW